MLVLKPKQTIATLVPDHASWFLEVDHPLEVLKNVQKGIRLYSDPGLTVFAEWQEELKKVQELLNHEPTIMDFLQKSTLGISAHVLTGKEAGYLFYCAVNNTSQDQLFSLLKQYYSKSPEYKYTERQYMKRRIAEITWKKDGTSFSLASTEGAVFGSFSGFLVEEVVRKSGLIFSPNFVEKLKRDHRYTGISGKPVRFYLHLSRSAEFFYQYLASTMQGLRLVKNLGEGLVLGFDRPNGLEWISEGYLLNPDPSEKGKHEHQLSADFRKFVPAGEAITFQFSLGELWHTFPEKASSNPADLLPQALESEVLFTWLEGESLKKYDKLLIAKVKDQEKLKEWLQQSELKPKGEGTLYRERFGELEITQHGNPNLGSLLGGALMSDWVPLFYVFDGRFFLVSDDVETLRRALKQNQIPLINKNIGSSFFTWKANGSRSLPLLMESASGIFRKNFPEWVPVLKGIESLEVADNGESENPSITCKAKFKVPSSGVDAGAETYKQFLDSTIISSPVRLEWKSQRKVFWLCQDLKNRVHVLNADLKPMFSYPMYGPWICKPQLLESVDKKKVTFLFSTAKSLRLLDVKGNELPESPILIPDSASTIDHVRVLDYDQANQYRIAIAGRYGEAYMTDISGKLLLGWNPYPHETPMSMAPLHVRIADKDLIFMLDKGGKLLMVNRKGEMQEGFPFQLAGRTNQPVYIEPGLDLRTSYVYTLSELGLVEKINFEGSSVSRIQLFRPGKETRFQFCIDQRQKTFAVARVSDKSVTVFDQGYRPIFECAISSPEVVVQHFHFGASNKIYAVTDLKSNRCILYSEAGQPLNASAIESSQPVEISQVPGKDGSFELVKAFQNKISTINIFKD